MGKGRPRGLRLEELLTVGDETDQAGRLLLEDSAPPKAQRRARRAGVDMQTVACPYRDTPSRLGGKMNQSAYEAFRADLRDVLEAVAWLWQGYGREEPTNAGSVQALVDVSKLGITLPLVLLHRRDEPVAPRGELPTFVASLFKASRGVFSAAFDMNRQSPGPTTAAEVITFAHDEGHLKRPNTGRVCAAPTRLMERTIGVMLTGDGSDGHASPLAELVDFGMLWAYYGLEREFNRALDGYRSLLEQVIARGRARDPRELFNATVHTERRRRRFGHVTEDFLEVANDIQQRLNRLLGRADNAPPMTFEDVLQAL